MKKVSTKATHRSKGTPNLKFISKNVQQFKTQTFKLTEKKKNYLSNGFSLKSNPGTKFTTQHFKGFHSSVMPKLTQKFNLSHKPNFSQKNPLLPRKTTQTFSNFRSFSTGNETFQAVIPLPNNNFSLFSVPKNKPIQSLLDNMKKEDPSILDVAILNSDGQRIATTNELNTINSEFKTEINSKKYKLNTTFGADSTGIFSAKKWSISPISETAGVIDENKLAFLKKEIYPLWQKKQEIDQKATNRANLIAIATLGYLGVQFTTLAYLTWWTFNWDIMEPVTYFITFSTGILGYIYFLITKKDYTYPDAYEGIVTSYLRKKYHQAEDFDVDRYFALEHEIKKIQPLALLEIPDEVERMNQVEKSK